METNVWIGESWSSPAPPPIVSNKFMCAIKNEFFLPLAHHDSKSVVNGPFLGHTPQWINQKADTDTVRTP